MEALNGTTTHVHSALVVKVVKKATDNTTFDFVLNLFHTLIKYDDKTVEAPSDPDTNALGSDYYFTQAANGQVTDVKVDLQEDSYYRNVKLSAINLFHTYIVPGQHTLLEDSLSGTHKSDYNGLTSAHAIQAIGSLEKNDMGGDSCYPGSMALCSCSELIKKGIIKSIDDCTQTMAVDACKSGQCAHDSTTLEGSQEQVLGLEVSKSFTDQDMVAFADSNLTHTGSFQMSHHGRTTLHGAGYLSHLASTHTAMLLNASGDAQRPELKASSKNNLGSTGTLTAFLQLAEDISSKGPLSNPKDPHTLTSMSLLEAAKSSILNHRAAQADDVDSLKVGMLALNSGLPTASQTNRALADLARSLSSAKTTALHVSKEIQTSLRLGGKMAHRYMFLLAAQGTSEAEELMSLILNDEKSSAGVQISAAMHLNGAFEVISSSSQRALKAFRGQGNRIQEALAEGAAVLPYNRSWSAGAMYGPGLQLEVGYQIDAVIGTNFDCKHPEFNYEASVVATSNMSIFGYYKEAVRAEAQYGKVDGSPFDDVISLTVWGKNVYERSIPQVDCSPHTYELYHKSPGIDKVYTLWVSIVPVTFRVQASLDVTVNWGWQECDDTLGAKLWLTSDPILSLAGSVSLDLLVLQGTTEIEGSFNTGLLGGPVVDGALCEVGFNVDKVNTPMSANFHSFYKRRDCTFDLTYPFLHCVWGATNDHSWWTWAQPAGQFSLVNKTWAIPMLR